MKKEIFLRLIIALMALPLAVACEPDTEEPAPTVKPKVTLAAVDATSESLTFKLTSEQATEVKWLCFGSSESAPTEATILSEGTAVEANTTVEVVVEGLDATSAYTILAVAINDDHSTLSQPLEMTTLAPATPTITLQAGAAGETTLTFTVTSANAKEVRWVHIVKGSRTVSPEQVLRNGTAVEANTTVEVTIEGLAAKSDYEIYAVAQSNQELVMAEVLEMSTIYIPNGYVIEATTASSTFSIASNNYYITFEQADKNLVFYADLYLEEGHQYIPSGSYPLGEYGPGELSTRYTKFSNGTEISEQSFASGEMVVVATPNEESREVHYSIEGLFYYDNGDSVTLTFEGMIEGISMPAADVPEGYYPFVPHPETNAPYRRKVNGEKPGEYVIVFTDAFWGELIIDIYADPTLCDDGNGAIPDGTYSLAEGTMDSYSQVIFYDPDYWYCNFSTCQVTVTRTGDQEFSFVVDASGSNGTTERNIWMTYTGKVKDMTR